VHEVGDREMSNVVAMFIAFDDKDEGAKFLEAVQEHKIAGYPVPINPDSEYGRFAWHRTKVLAVYRSGTEEAKLNGRQPGYVKALMDASDEDLNDALKVLGPRFRNRLRKALKLTSLTS